jgi:hypothetical protein
MSSTRRGPSRVAARFGEIHVEKKKRKQETKTTRRRKKANEDIVQEDAVL